MELLKEQNLKDPQYHLSYMSKYYLVSKRLLNDSRFKAIDERDREEVFQDYIDKLGEHERDTKRQLYNRRIDMLKAAFQADKSINMDTRWSDITATMEQTKHLVPVYAEAEPIEKLTAFEEYIKSLEQEDSKVKKQEKRRRERKNREKFAALIEALFKHRIVNQRTKWRVLINGTK